MRFMIRTSLAAAAFLLPFGAQAQYSQGPQPYSSQDPQNYGSPAGEQYQSHPDPLGAKEQRYDAQTQDAQGSQGATQYEQVSQAPPALPTYEQPESPGDGNIWTPGYWAFGRGGYFWVPGAWVQAPYEYALWTPGYWGYQPTGYFWNAGYWGRSVGFYGGINYGFGYFGTGYCGGYWNSGRFFYNREYTRINHYERNVYRQHFPGAGDVYPRGNSYSTIVRPRNAEFRGGSYNRAGDLHSFAGGIQATARPVYNGGSGGFRGQQQEHSAYRPAPGSFPRPQQQAYARSQYSGGGNYGGAQSNGNAGHPQQQGPQSFRSQPGAPAYGGGPRMSAPSNGGGFHGGANSPHGRR